MVSSTITSGQSGQEIARQKIKTYLNTNPSYVSKIAKHYPINNIAMVTTESDDPGDSSSTEIKKYYTFDQTGHIMISSTVKDETQMDPAVKDVFQKAIVFFSAWSAAVAKAEKTLYDYDAISAIINKSGYFVNMGLQDREFNYTSHGITLGTSIISDALGAVNAGASSMEVAQKILSGLGGQLRVSSQETQSTKKIAQLMFVCQNLMGIPIVSVSLFYIQKSETLSVVSSNCSTSTTDNINFKYHQEDFMFVDPDLLKKCSTDFVQTQEYMDLINKLASYVPGAPSPA